MQLQRGVGQAVLPLLAVPPEAPLGASPCSAEAAWHVCPCVHHIVPWNTASTDARALDVQCDVLSNFSDWRGEDGFDREWLLLRLIQAGIMQQLSSSESVLRLVMQE